ncbi:amino acid ABC transporter membrane protein 2 (PAAT family) [Rhizobium azibense]|uniref:Amino acid ABC transporter membrane protein 2 (PAAT family) n=1 Tax=Rhizobium azibense TaxID=1136135 RepID=A0A4R3QJH8_9HYPH|nr:amino acid ABC transporter permease [Rhizobium azibense]TCU21244.1 amino acid ABC transporter membrane protein 2 (PAAT family) [Rhizobium azibense]
MISFVRTILENIPDWGPRLLDAVWVTCTLTICGFLLAFPVGIAVEFVRTRRSPILRLTADAYVSVMRGVPILVILYLLYFALPEAGIALPSLLAGILGLALVYSAYLAEVFRAGFAAVPSGQREAAMASGLGPWQTFRLILLPQVIRKVLPPLLINLVSLLKDSSICALIAVPELTLTSRAIMSESFLPLHVFVVTACGYFMIAWPASLAVRSLERWLCRRAEGSETAQSSQDLFATPA